VPSVTVIHRWILPGQVPPSASLKSLPTAPTDASGQAPSSAGKSTPSSALGAAPALKALRMKKSLLRSLLYKYSSTFQS
jgi:hypothetical protein